MVPTTVEDGDARRLWNAAQNPQVVVKSLDLYERSIHTNTVLSFSCIDIPCLWLNELSLLLVK